MSFVLEPETSQQETVIIVDDETDGFRFTQGVIETVCPGLDKTEALQYSFSPQINLN